MATFLIVAAAGTALVALLLVWPLLAGGARARSRDAADAGIFRDQLAELDREIARGAVSEAEAAGTRAEIARRLIAATRRAEAAGTLAPGPRGVSRTIAAVALIAAPALAALVYVQIGSPGQPDLPLAARSSAELAGMPSQEDAEKMAAGKLPPPEEVEPEYAALIAKLEKIVAQRPDDAQGHRLLARGLARSGRWVEARQTYDQLIRILGDGATAEDHADRAEAMIFAAGGYVSPEAMEALGDALKLDPSLTMARYYAGFALRQTGRTAEAVRLWQALLQEDTAAAQPRGKEWRDALAALIAETGGAPAAEASPAPGSSPAPGPTPEDVDAAGDMTPEQRAAFIESMVARLEDRLAGQGGTAEEWVRLINAYMQLGRKEDARRILALSQERLDEATARAFVREQALVMGLGTQ